MSTTNSPADSPRATLSVIGWVVSWVYVLTFLPVWITTATQYSDDAWVASLLLAIVIGGFSLGLIYMGGRQTAWTRWLALPHLLILFIGFGVIYSALSGATIAGHHLAAVALETPNQTDISTPLWHRFYALVHIAFFIAVAFFALRPVGHQNTSAANIHPRST